MASGRHPDDFWPRHTGWEGPGAASPEGHDDAGSDGEDDVDMDELLATPDETMEDVPMKKPSSKRAVQKKPSARRSALKKPAASAAAADGERAVDKEDEKDQEEVDEESKAIPKKRAKAKAKQKVAAKPAAKPPSKPRRKATGVVDKSKGCSKCRWQSGCKSCGWRGISSKEKEDHEKKDEDHEDHEEPEEDEDDKDGEEKWQTSSSNGSSEWHGPSMGLFAFGCGVIVTVAMAVLKETRPPWCFSYPYLWIIS